MGSEKLDESDIHLPSSLKDFEFQQFNQTCLVACAHNMLIDVACKNNNKNMIKSLRTIRNRCTDLKGRKKEEYFDTTPQPPAPIISYLENLLEKYNYEVFKEQGMTDFKVLDPSNYNDRRSICTIDVKEDDYFSEIYGVERDKSGYGDPVLGHAINVLDVIDEEKTIIFDPIFRRMKRKDVSETKIKKYLLKEAEKEGVFAVPKNLLESWWDSGFDSRWVVVLDPTDASQTTISSYTKEEKEEHHRRRYDGNI